MIGMTLCSGIGAPEVAAPWVDWRFASEIEKFPRAVLQDRFGYKTPKDHNQGEPILWDDMTEVSPDVLRAHGIPLPDLIVAGTPCQAFSVAGLRKGLDDARGNLTLKFVEICHAIADVRPFGKLAVLWENVPGVLSDKGNAFGCFLGGLVGAVDALPPPGDGSWPGEGMVEGPRARAAWAVLDAQWFGVAQRRRRVFVVVDFGSCVDPAAVLLEPDSLRGNSAPRREAGQGVAPTISARPTGGGGLGTDFDLDGGLIASTGDVSHCLNAGGMGRIDYETETMVAHSLRGEGFDASEDGTGRGTPIISVFDPNQVTSKTNRSVPTPNLCHTLPATPSPPIAFSSKDFGADAVDNVAPTLRAGGHSESHANAGVPPAIAFHPTQNTISSTDGSIHAMGCGSSGGQASAAVAIAGQDWAVRRLTPTECHRLQGFPDDHCAITYRGKPVADGPQYKALGNSMAVPVIRWILERMRESMK